MTNWGTGDRAGPRATLATAGFSLAVVTAGCGMLTGDEIIDGVAVGPVKTVDGASFRRLEASARETWVAAHGGPAPIGYELHELRQGPWDFLMVVTTRDGARHAVVLHCDAAAFPARGSCS